MQYLKVFVPLSISLADHKVVFTSRICWMIVMQIFDLWSNVTFIFTLLFFCSILQHLYYTRL
jgi:hypothetical protein